MHKKKCVIFASSVTPEENMTNRQGVCRGKQGPERNVTAMNVLSITGLGVGAHEKSNNLADEIDLLSS